MFCCSGLVGVVSVYNLVLVVFRFHLLSFKLVERSFALFKRVGIFLLIFTLLCSIVVTGQFVGLASAQTDSPTIRITSGGRVVGTDWIERRGDVYTFTGDVFGIIVVEKDGITIDGAGYAIRGNWSGVDLNRYSNGPSQPGCGGVVVKNVRFYDSGHIFASSNNNSFINNTFEGGGLDIRYGSSPDYIGNVIKHNVFINCDSAIFIDWTMLSVVTENNFINCKIAIAIYGWVEFDRNYWSNYETSYFGAKEIGDTGVWDTPYNYDDSVWCPFVDSNPLVSPVAGAGAPEITEKPTSAPTGSTIDKKSEPLLTTILMVSVVFVVIVSTGLLIYFKRHKQI